MKKGILTGLVALGLSVGGAAWADYPMDDEITFVIPYSPGGGFDTIVRQFAPALGEAMGATVVPENISGAGGARGGQAVHRADPDGYTIGIYNIPSSPVNEVSIAISTSWPRPGSAATPWRSAAQRSTRSRISVRSARPSSRTPAPPLPRRSPRASPFDHIGCPIVT
ncbi:MAG: tripartite tricarboxylate transporter substrate-binding protein [Paracoccaceae bacterium]